MVSRKKKSSSTGQGRTEESPTSPSVAVCSFFVAARLFSVTSFVFGGLMYSALLFFIFHLLIPWFCALSTEVGSYCCAGRVILEFPRLVPMLRTRSPLSGQKQFTHQTNQFILAVYHWIDYQIAHCGRMSVRESRVCYLSAASSRQTRDSHGARG